MLPKFMLLVGISLAWASPAFCASILLLRDGPAWYSPPEDANVDELAARGLSFDVATSAAIGALDLTPYSLIIVESAQSQVFYNRLFPSPPSTGPAEGPLLANIDSWVAAGGVLSFGGTDSASGAFGGGVWRGSLPGGVTKAFGTDSDDTHIAAPDHPIVTGVFGAGNGGALADGSCHADLDCWDFSTFGDFENLPAGATIILRTATGFPVLVEYSYGLGTVVAATTTTEWMYNGGFGNVPVNRKLLANALGYQLHLAGVPEPRTLLLIGVAAVTAMLRGTMRDREQGYGTQGARSDTDHSGPDCAPPHNRTRREPLDAECEPLRPCTSVASATAASIATRISGLAPNAPCAELEGIEALLRVRLARPAVERTTTPVGVRQRARRIRVLPNYDLSCRPLLAPYPAELRRAESGHYVEQSWRPATTELR